MGENGGIGKTLANLPTWLYFGLIILAMAYITLYPLGFPIPISDQTRYVYAAVDGLETGDIMFVDMGYESGTIAFMEPGMVAVFRHAISKGIKLVIVSSAPESPMLVGRLMEKVNPEASGYVYGEDWVHLGYFAGGEPAYASLLGDINGLVTEDYQQTPTSDLPLMAELGAPTHEKIALVGIWTAGGDVVEGWIRQAAVKYDLTFITEVNEMMVPTLLPYYPINLDGILNGGIGAAEYENLSGFAGEAIKLSDMMTMGGLVVLVFLILGNIGFLMTKGGKS
jgi:hypothetical protein